ncbi:hypothetical protein C7S15_8816 (plasmid) [Burkholderia cepacia]|nr:hypothetical protein [Burkholderia cepacia]
MVAVAREQPKFLEKKRKLRVVVKCLGRLHQAIHEDIPPVRHERAPAALAPFFGSRRNYRSKVCGRRAPVRAMPRTVPKRRVRPAYRKRVCRLALLLGARDRKEAFKRLVQTPEQLEGTFREYPLIRSFRFYALCIATRLARQRAPGEVWQWLARFRAEPPVLHDLQIFRNAQPNHTPARRVGQPLVDGHLSSRAVNQRHLELNVSHRATAAHDEVITARIKFRTQDLDVQGAELPEPPHGLANEDVLDNPLPQNRVFSMPRPGIDHCIRFSFHVRSALSLTVLCRTCCLLRCVALDERLVVPLAKRCRARDIKLQGVRVLAGAFKHPARSLFQIGGDLGLLVVTKVLERVPHAIRFGNCRFAIHRRIAVDPAIECDLPAASVHLFAQHLLGCGRERDHSRKGAVLEKQHERCIELFERKINAVVGLGWHESPLFTVMNVGSVDTRHRLNWQ